VTFLIHDLSSHRIAGLHIRTGKVTPDRRIHFEVSRPPFFIDERLYVLLVLLQPNDRVHDFCPVGRTTRPRILLDDYA